MSAAGAILRLLLMVAITTIPCWNCNSLSDEVRLAPKDLTLSVLTEENAKSWLQSRTLFVECEAKDARLPDCLQKSAISRILSKEVLPTIELTINTTHQAWNQTVNHVNEKLTSCWNITNITAELESVKLDNIRLQKQCPKQSFWNWGTQRQDTNGCEDLRKNYTDLAQLHAKTVDELTRLKSTTENALQLSSDTCSLHDEFANTVELEDGHTLFDEMTDNNQTLPTAKPNEVFFLRDKNAQLKLEIEKLKREVSQLKEVEQKWQNVQDLLQNPMQLATRKMWESRPDLQMLMDTLDKHCPGFLPASMTMLSKMALATVS